MKNIFIWKRKKNRIKILNNYFKIVTGDIISINFRLKGFSYVFTGLCFGVKKKSMIWSNAGFFLRNIFSRIAVEYFIMFYNVCRLNVKFLDYARKKFNYRKAKLYYLRLKSNLESLVKI